MKLLFFVLNNLKFRILMLTIIMACILGGETVKMPRYKFLYINLKKRLLRLVGQNDVLKMLVQTKQSKTTKLKQTDTLSLH